MRVELTDFAKAELKAIYSYYFNEVSEQVAAKILNHLLDKIELLETQPSLGTKETMLESMKMNHRYMVCGNYKIIFYRTDKVIYVTDVFDCRQNPVRMMLRQQ